MADPTPEYMEAFREGARWALERVSMSQDKRCDLLDLLDRKITEMQREARSRAKRGGVK